MKGCRFLILFLLISLTSAVAAQTPDSGHARFDTIRIMPGPDSFPPSVTDTVARRDTFVLPATIIRPRHFDSILLQGHPFFPFHASVRLRESQHIASGKEDLFYSIMGVLLLFAIARAGFSRYLADLFRMFFRANLRQRNAKDQLPQSPLPSLLLNAIFFLSGALFLILLFRRFGLGDRFSFWPLLGYTTGALAALYFGKFLVLKLVGWMFRVPAALEAYSFIVFTSNKITGMLLLPFLVLLAFTEGLLAQVALTLSLTLTGGVFCYRYFLSYVTVQRQVRLHLFHFVLYLLAFEVVPLLLINKLLFRVLG